MRQSTNQKGCAFVASIVFSVTAILHSSASLASEIDSFSDRHLLSMDAAPILNQFTQNLIDQGLREANEEAKKKSKYACNEARLRKHLIKHLKGNLVHGPIEKFVNFAKSDEFPMIRRPKSTSIYQDVNFGEGPILFSLKSAVGGIFMMEDKEGQKIVLGADKLGHFFTEGLVYYTKWSKGKTLAQVLNWGISTENKKFGFYTTGVFSHADLVANAKGMTFWANLVENRMDLPFSKAKPIFRCRDDQWEKINQFDWLNYVDLGMDEGINCNDYKKSLEPKVLARIKEAGDKVGLHLECPLLPEKLESLRQQYGTYQSYLLDQ